MGQLSEKHFQPKTLDKVQRMLELLAELQRHPDLKGKLALHGGTALNLFMLDVPRLSVDIDISYVGALDKNEMLKERAVIERGLKEVAHFQGYDIHASAESHAGTTFILRYKNKGLTDHVKIDCIYMNRSPLLPLQLRQSPLLPGANVLMFDELELAGGKVKAFFDRIKIRDLYDISNLKKYFDALGDPDECIHDILLYYAALSACFPHGFLGRTQRFANSQKEFKEKLVPMLHAGAPIPSLEGLMATAEDFIGAYILPRNEEEHRFLELFARGDFHPELLFNDKEMSTAAYASPEARWKLFNLKKLQEKDD